MEHHTPHLKPKLTLDDGAGGAFVSKILVPWSGLADITANCVPLRGAPDITMDNKIVNLVTSEEESESSHSDSSTFISPMELSSRSTLSKATSLCFCPDKLGELLAAMLIKAFCKAIRKLKASLEIREVVVHGMFLNRVENEVIQCCLTVTPTLITGSRRRIHTTKRTVLQAQQQSVSTASELCAALGHFNRS